MVLADNFAHQNFRKQNMPDSPPSPRQRPTLGRTDSPPSAPEPDSPSSVYRDGLPGFEPQAGQSLCAPKVSRIMTDRPKDSRSGR